MDLEEERILMNLGLGLFSNLTASQDISPFGGIFTLFVIVFAIVFVLVILTFALNFWRSLKYRGAEGQVVNPQGQSPEATKEVIREVVKIRCPYCGSLYDEDENKCPNCGAQR